MRNSGQTEETILSMNQNCCIMNHHYTSCDNIVEWLLLQVTFGIGEWTGCLGGWFIARWSRDQWGSNECHGDRAHTRGGVSTSAMGWSKDTWGGAGGRGNVVCSNAIGSSIGSITGCFSASYSSRWSSSTSRRFLATLLHFPTPSKWCRCAFRLSVSSCFFQCSNSRLGRLAYGGRSWTWYFRVDLGAIGATLKVQRIIPIGCIKCTGSRENTARSAGIQGQRWRGVWDQIPSRLGSFQEWFKLPTIWRMWPFLAFSLFALFDSFHDGSLFSLFCQNCNIK